MLKRTVWLSLALVALMGAVAAVAVYWRWWLSTHSFSAPYPRRDREATHKVTPSAPPLKTTRPRKVIVDSKMSSSSALGSNGFPKHVLARMAIVEVEYLGFDGFDHRGQIVVDRSLAGEVRAIFAELRKIRYPIRRVVPVVRYGWDDIRSMRDNNTSGFNYRGQVTPNGRSNILSKHALGRAIDLNPYLNPYVSTSGKALSAYRPAIKGTLTRHSAATKIFLSRGWKWGGNWPGGKDYQHFVKP